MIVPILSHRRLLHTASHGPRRFHPSSVGILFDIDGVLLKGKVVLPQAVKSLHRLHQHKVPFAFLTNGGGVTEQSKAEELSSKFRLPISPSQVILSHTPMTSLVSKYGDKPVLVLGKSSCKEVALEYGLKKPILAEEVLAWNPSIWPFKPTIDPGVRPPQNVDLNNTPISAIVSCCSFHISCSNIDH
jgi:HAD superfamily hydrolase (TIGR01456 family)